MRRLQREAATNAVLGARFPTLVRPWMTDGQRQAITEPLLRLQNAVDSKQNPSAIGEAKELVEAACKITIKRAGQTASSGAALPALFKQAHTATGADAPGSPLGNGLAPTVQRLAELRKAVGTGHGRASSSDVPARDARIAASAAVAVSEFLLNVR
jgi:Abortive infection C-terminus